MFPLLPLAKLIQTGPIHLPSTLPNRELISTVLILQADYPTFGGERFCANGLIFSDPLIKAKAADEYIRKVLLGLVSSWRSILLFLDCKMISFAQILRVKNSGQPRYASYNYLGVDLHEFFHIQRFCPFLPMDLFSLVKKETNHHRWIIPTVGVAVCAVAIFLWGCLWMRVALVWVILSTVLTAVGAMLAGVMLIRIPADYFCEHSSHSFWPDKHPILRLCGRIVKNLLGIVIIVTGALLSLPGMPGPGLLTLLLGIMLLDIPGKRRLERWLISLPAVLATINYLRRRHNKSPMVVESAS